MTKIKLSLWIFLFATASSSQGFAECDILHGKSREEVLTKKYARIHYKLMSLSHGMGQTPEEIAEEETKLYKELSTAVTEAKVGLPQIEQIALQKQMETVKKLISEIAQARRTVEKKFPVGVEIYKNGSYKDYKSSFSTYLQPIFHPGKPKMSLGNHFEQLVKLSAPTRPDCLAVFVDSRSEDYWDADADIDYQMLKRVVAEADQLASELKGCEQNLKNLNPQQISTQGTDGGNKLIPGAQSGDKTDGTSGEPKK